MSLKFNNYSWWRFFDKNGDSTNFTYDEVADKWTGTIYLPEVSTGLIEYEPLYILQDFWDFGPAGPGTGGHFYSPRKLNWSLAGCPGATYNNIEVRWKDNVQGSTATNVPEFFLWTIEDYPGPSPKVVKHDSLDIDLTQTSGNFLTDSIGGVVPAGGTGQSILLPISDPPKSQALSVRVGLESENEDSFVRTLQLVDPYYLPSGTTAGSIGCTATEHVFAEITFYGQTVGEDVRLETMIENFGTSIKNSDFKIFDDTDVNEPLPDFIKLNSKRKELLLEWDNIFPFTGAYKALINILKYFGYDQVTLKEYWLNVDELKGNNPQKQSRIVYKQTPIEDLFSTDPKTAGTKLTNLIPSKLYKKTSKFGLFYDITRDSGKFDEDGIPIVEEAFLFSNEEILIKLFALKQKLKNYFLPLNARIVDIIGEAVFYARYDVNIWNDVVRVDDVELNINPCVKIDPKEGCSLITDLTAQNFLGVKVPPDLNMAGISDFVTYSVGVTQTDTTTGNAYNYSGTGDAYIMHDTVSGASFTYLTPSLGLTAGQVIDGIISQWSSQTNEPWTRFTLTKEVGQDSTVPASMTNAYSWMYAVQDDIIGPTGGVNFVLSTSTVAGITSGVYTTPGVTSFSLSLGTGPMSYYASAFLGYFDGTNIEANSLNDYPCAPIAAPFVLTNCSFDINWDEMVVNWNLIDYKEGGTSWSNYAGFTYSYTLPSYPLGTTNSYTGATGVLPSGPSGGAGFTGGATPGIPYHPPGPTFANGYAGPTGPTQNPTLYDWENIGYENFTEMQWIVTYEDTPTPTGATSYIIDSGLLSLEDGQSYPLLLKYTGKYTVELILYDSWGGTSKWIQKGALCVETKDVDFIGHYRFRECDYQWDTKTIKRQSDQVPAPEKPIYPTWEMYNSTWGLPLQENEEMSMQDLTYNDLDRIEFYQTQNDPQFQGFCENVDTLPQSPGSTPSSGLTDLKSYIWNLIENNATWDDICHLWWDGIGPHITQAKIDWDTPFNSFNNIVFAFFEEPFVGNPDNVRLSNDLASILAIPAPAYGDIVKNMNPSIGPTGPEITGVYQYLGGPVGVTGGTSWVESDININTLTLTNINVGGSLTGNDIWKEIVRQFNVQMQNNGGATGATFGEPLYDIMDQFILYYQEEYEDPGNPLFPYLQFVTKEYSVNKRKHIRAYHPQPALFDNIELVNEVGATANYVSTYETVNFGDMGDIPNYFEIFAVGASGGQILLPGPTSYYDMFGELQTGITYWPYSFGATNLTDLWQQLTYYSDGLAPTGPSAGIAPIEVNGPIAHYGWNIVYGASGYTGPTGSTAFPPPTGLTAIKIQGYPEYFSSHDYSCVKFQGLGSTGATDHVLGGTSGIAGTMCGRSITANSSWNNLRIHQYTNNFPLLTQIQFNYSLSPMNGKTYPVWKLIKENDENWENIYYNNPYFSYMFTQKGSYTIELTLTDNNGNRKTKTKKEFIKII